VNPIVVLRGPVSVDDFGRLIKQAKAMLGPNVLIDTELAAQLRVSFALRSAEAPTAELQMMPAAPSASDEILKKVRRALDCDPKLEATASGEIWEEVMLLVADAGDTCDALGFPDPHRKWGQIACAHGAIHDLKERIDALQAENQRLQAQMADERRQERVKVGDELAAFAKDLREEPTAGLLPYALSDIASRLQAGRTVEDGPTLPTTIDVTPA